MKDERLVAWTAAFAYLVASYPALEPRPERLKVWDEALSDLTPGEIVEAARRVVRTHTHGQPAPAHLREAIKGRCHRVPVHTVDVWGRRVLTSSGGYALAGFVDYEGDTPPQYVLETEVVDRRRITALTEHELPLLEEGAP